MEHGGKVVVTNLTPNQKAGVRFVIPPPIKCPKCGSANIVSIQPFDYRKGCKDCKHVFSSNPHN